ncbi:MAG: ATP-binding protein, partial [Actinomycetota bacterium]
MAQAAYRFGTATTGETFGIPLDGPQVTFMLRGGRHSLRSELAQRYFALHHKAASQTALADAMLTLEGIGQAWETELHLRVAPDGLERSTWIDLGDDTGRAIHLTDNSWTIQQRAPILFRRTALTAALPEPVSHGQGLDVLWRLLNVEPADRPLVAAWLVAALVPNIPHPTLALFGEQGTGKTTATKLLVSIVDPSPVPARKPPRDADSWVTAAAGSWVVAIDNLSTIPLWLSDSLCRAVTGDGDVR